MNITLFAPTYILVVFALPNKQKATQETTLSGFTYTNIIWKSKLRTMPLSLQSAQQTASSLLSFFSKEIKSLSTSDFKFKLKAAKRAKLIDLGSREEYKELHIPGSVNYDSQSPEFFRTLQLMDKSRPYFIYCRNGMLSEKVVRKMEEMGFRRVYYLMNGLQSWIGTLERSY